MKKSSLAPEIWSFSCLMWTRQTAGLRIKSKNETQHKISQADNPHSFCSMVKLSWRHWSHMQMVFPVQRDDIFGTKTKVFPVWTINKSTTKKNVLMTHATIGACILSSAYTGKSTNITQCPWQVVRDIPLQLEKDITDPGNRQGCAVESPERGTFAVPHLAPQAEGTEEFRHSAHQPRSHFSLKVRQ